MKTKTKWAILLGLLLSVAAFGYAIYYGATTEKRQRDEQINWAKEAVKATLLDGETALFRNVRVTADNVITCGEVNGKNLYGAYTGFTGFDVTGTPDTGHPYVEMESSKEGQPGYHTLVKERCGN
jgi:hypothetical protein